MCDDGADVFGREKLMKQITGESLGICKKYAIV